MKKIYTLRQILLITFLFCAVVADAQIHPLAYGPGFSTISNWYKDYVGMRFEVTAPAVVAGDKQFTAANSGAGFSTDWGGLLTTPIVNTQVVMPQAGDSLANVAISVPMTGKIALIYRGVNEYSDKALAAQSAGAIACVIINSIPGDPVEMAPGVVAGSVTIPVFMISKADGDALDLQYCSLVTVRMTITHWGQNNANDLGFVPDGIAGWHDYAIPHNQLFSSSNPIAYRGMDGAFIANYGSHNATHVKVSDTLTYTPSGGSPSLIHTDVSPTLTTFHPIDSIYAMLAPTEYNFAPTGSGNGRFDLKYTISSDSVDQFTGDNNATYSFYTTDSVYSKGQYNFVNNVPTSGIYEAPTGVSDDFMWGPMYYVKHGGTAISSVQFSLVGPTVGPIGLSSVNIYAFRWDDGLVSLDSIVQNGELTLVSLGVYNFNSTDTSGGVFKVQMGDPSFGTPGTPILLDSNSWYYIAAEVPPGYFLGCDGHASAYPRIYSRSHASGTRDYSNFLWGGAYFTGSFPMSSYPLGNELPCPFTQTYFINSVDSFNYSQSKGMIPSVAMIVNNTPYSISGSTTVCVGSSTTLSYPFEAGTWSSSNTSIATVNSAGVVHGVALGVATISYTLLTGTIARSITVAPIPAVITGSTTICSGYATTLLDATTGGTWSSSSPGIFEIDTTTGVAGAGTPGTAIITYSTAPGCSSTFTITVDALPGTITGPSTPCVGGTTLLHDGVAGGTWSSTNTAVATIVSGTVTGLSAGTALISYVVVGGCYTTDIIVVMPQPDAGTITGASTVCANTTITLSDSGAGGVWTSSDNTLAGVSSSGLVLGVSAGAVTITYTVTNSCGTATATFPVNVLSATSAPCLEQVNNNTGTQTSLSAYPNPNDGAFSILLTTPSGENAMVTITNVVGEKVKEFVIAPNAAINVKLAQPSGIYFISVVTGSGRYVAKVMVE